MLTHSFGHCSPWRYSASLPKCRGAVIVLLCYRGALYGCANTVRLLLPPCCRLCFELTISSTVYSNLLTAQVERKRLMIIRAARATSAGTVATFAYGTLFSRGLSRSNLSRLNRGLSTVFAHFTLFPFFSLSAGRQPKPILDIACSGFHSSCHHVTAFGLTLMRCLYGQRLSLCGRPVL